LCLGFGIGISGRGQRYFIFLRNLYPLVSLTEVINPFNQAGKDIKAECNYLVRGLGLLIQIEDEWEF